MLNTFSKYFSLIFQPLVVPSLVFLTLLHYYPLLHVNDQYYYFLLLLSVLFTFIFPALMLLTMYRLRWISTIDIVDRKERVIPYVLTTFFYGVMIWVMFVKGVHYTFIVSAVAMLLAILISFGITFFWKISAHLVAFGGLVGLGFRLCLNFYNSELIFLFLLSLIITGLLMMSRIHLKSHSLAQVYLGFALGFVVCFMSTYLLF